MSNIVVIDDGQFRWAADADKLRSALETNGWVHAGSDIWREPEGDPEPGDEPYTVLCGQLESLAGEGSTNPLTEEMITEFHRFTFRGDLSGWLWS